jgi:ABC-type uncharacterized transport system fused permease/ATPase subunit
MSDVTPPSLVGSSKHLSNSPSFRDDVFYTEDEGSGFFELSVPKNQITRRHNPEGLITNDLNGADFISCGLNSGLCLPILTNVSVSQLLFQQNALVFLLLKAQDMTICNFCLCILSPYMFQPAWVIFRGRNVSA